ncbi:MAG: DUF1045 domain-containing protein [Hyphomicrobiales bacterium]|nr:DUF1045 domain-containing protein [Hyphomicrobiales bacterium]MDE2115643.1 DUF1045 domain-containing protein [Hyphomicrobiales bacterium]
MRYAIYFMPAVEAPLWQFGSSVLGYDAASGEDCAFPSGTGIAPDDWRSMTQAPRQYGFHATLKAPFELRDASARVPLLASMQAFANSWQSFVLADVEVVALGAFLALSPTRPSAPLQALADACVREFDDFRAPLDPVDLARRQASAANERQRENVTDWGYPYVFRDFKFHMTLTGALGHGPRQEMLETLRGLYAPIQKPLQIDGFALFAQPSRAERFKVVERFTFGQ